MRNKYSFSLSLEKGLNILSLFLNSPESLSIKEIQQKTGHSRTVVFRFVNTLVELGFLAKDPKSKLIQLGRRSVYFASCVLKNFNMTDLVKPFIDEIHSGYHITADAATFSGDTLIVIYRRQISATYNYNLPWVNKEWHSTALGKAILSTFPYSAVQYHLERIALVKHTNHTMTEIPGLMKDIEETRDRGFSISNEECYLGFISIGAPLISPSKEQAVGAISFDFPSLSYKVDEICEKYAELLVQASKNISRTLIMV